MIADKKRQTLLPLNGSLSSKAHFLITHLWLPLLFFLAALWWIESRELDFQLEDYLYRLNHRNWDNGITDFLALYFHDAPKIFLKRMVMFLWAFALLAVLLHEKISVPHTGVAKLQRWFSHYRSGLFFLSLFLPLGPFLTNVFKHTTHIDCPWHLVRYGGEHAFQSIFSLPTRGDGHCFPSSHASTGFGLLAAYFFAREYFYRYRFHVLSVAVSAGSVFGLTQMYRGAHFLSHVIGSMALCWFVALAGYCVWVHLRSDEERQGVKEQ